jgi:hypothetical protein
VRALAAVAASALIGWPGVVCAHFAEAPSGQQIRSFDGAVISRQEKINGLEPPKYVFPMERAVYGEVPRACGHSGFPSGLISDSSFPNGGLNERAALCGDG